MQHGPASEAPNAVQRWINCEAPPWATAMVYAVALSLVLGVNAVILLGVTAGAFLGTAAVFLLAFGVGLLLVLRTFRRHPDRASMRVVYWPTLNRDGA